MLLLTLALAVGVYFLFEFILFLHVKSKRNVFNELYMHIVFMLSANKNAIYCHELGSPLIDNITNGEEITINDLITNMVDDLLRYEAKLETSLSIVPIAKYMYESYMYVEYSIREEVQNKEDECNKEEECDEENQNIK